MTSKTLYIRLPDISVWYFHVFDMSVLLFLLPLLTNTLQHAF